MEIDRLVHSLGSDYEVLLKLPANALRRDAREFFEETAVGRAMVADVVNELQTSLAVLLDHAGELSDEDCATALENARFCRRFLSWISDKIGDAFEASLPED